MIRFYNEAFIGFLDQTKQKVSKKVKNFSHSPLRLKLRCLPKGYK